LEILTGRSTFVGQTKLLESFPSFSGGKVNDTKGWQGKKPKKLEEINWIENWSEKKIDFAFGGMQRVML